MLEGERFMFKGGEVHDGEGEVHVAGGRFILKGEKFML